MTLWDVFSFWQDGLQFSLQGYTFSGKAPDVTISLVSPPVQFPGYTIENISDDDNIKDFRAIYKVVSPWEIQVRGKVSKDLKIADFTDTLKVMFPPKYNSLGFPTEAVSNEELIKETIEAKREEMDNYVIEALYDQLMLAAKNVVNDQLSYAKEVHEIEVQGFKSNKKHDYSAWDVPYTSGLEILNKYNSGFAPADLYSEYKSIFDFWEKEVEKALTDPKEYKKELRVASNNLINLLLLVNPAAIKDTYIEHSNFVFAGPNYEKGEIVADAKARMEAFNSIERAYDEVFAISPLRENYYEVVYFDKKGKERNGVLKLSKIYGKNPAEACNSFRIYNKSDYDESMGEPRSKDKLDEKDLTGYALLGIKYENLQYKDPTVLSIGKNIAFMEEMIDGKASLYRMFEQGGAEGLIVGGQDQGDSPVERFVVSCNGDTELVFNYSRLAKMLSDNKEVAEKIENGEYGNKPEDGNASGLSKLLQEGSTNEISEEALVQIVTDFNQ